MGGPGSGRRPWKGSKPLKNWGGGKGTGPKGSTVKFGGTPVRSVSGVGRLGPPKARSFGSTRSNKSSPTKKMGGSKEWRRSVAAMLRSKPKSMRRAILKHIKATKT